MEEEWIGVLTVVEHGWGLAMGCVLVVGPRGSMVASKRRVEVEMVGRLCMGRDRSSCGRVRGGMRSGEWTREERRDGERDACGKNWESRVDREQGIRVRDVGKNLLNIGCAWRWGKLITS